MIEEEAMAVASQGAWLLQCSASVRLPPPQSFLRLYHPPPLRSLRTALPSVSGTVQPRSCFASLVSREDKSQLLAGVDKTNAEVVARILEQAKAAAERWEVTHSDFLTPSAMDDALRALKRLSDVGIVVSGGYPQAERCRLSVGSSEAISMIKVEDGIGYPGAVAVFSVSGNFMFDSADHGDFLGSVLGTGITREKIGDIIVQGDLGAQILVVPELVDYLVASLTQRYFLQGEHDVPNSPLICSTELQYLMDSPDVQVRAVSVKCSPILLRDIDFQPPRVDVVKSVEASLRVDALASAGFRMSRSKLVDLISGGDVRVNWREVSKNGLTLKAGDVISVRGKGRMKVGEITTTKKGKYAVELIRYL